MASNKKKREIKAAGGVVIRKRSGSPEVALVHRPRYDDWSLPKGKLEDGESFKDGALREVEEETGFTCELGEELPSVEYRDRKGRPKRVRYWRMTRIDGDFRPNEECDELRWLTPKEAIRLLDYDHDRRLVASLPEAG
jgi:8-oxo-dGTP pyrophosphatase MutT (NUDIX family)